MRQWEGPEEGDGGPKKPKAAGAGPAESTLAARRSVSRGPGCAPHRPHPVGSWNLYAVSLFLRM